MIIGVDGSRAFAAERTGTENYSYRLLRALAAVDRKNRYLVYTRGREAPPEFRKFPSFSFIKIGWPRFWTQGGLAARTWRDKLDLLFVPAHTLPVLARPGLPTVVTIHGLEYEYLPEHYQIPQKYYLTWSTRYAASRAKRLIAVSEFTKNDLVKRLGVRPEKVRVIHEGADILSNGSKVNYSNKDKILSKLNIKRPFVLFVGVVQPRKNLVRLIEAFGLAVKSLEKMGRKELRGLELVIAGKPGWMFEEIYRAPERCGVAERVKFTGYITERELQGLYQEASVYVQPSLTEGFGLPVVEAMAAGVPVITSRAGALPEIVGEAGRLIDPLDTEAMAKALVEVLMDSDLRGEMIFQGKRRAGEFSWTAAARETLAVFEEAAGI